MKSFEIKALGLEELSSEEITVMNGGTDVYWYKGSNGLIYFGTAIVNGVKYAIHGVKKLLGQDDEINVVEFE